MKTSNITWSCQEIYNITSSICPPHHHHHHYPTHPLSLTSQVILVFDDFAGGGTHGPLLDDAFTQWLARRRLLRVGDTLRLARRLCGCGKRKDTVTCTSVKILESLSSQAFQLTSRKMRTVEVLPRSGPTASTCSDKQWFLLIILAQIIY